MSKSISSSEACSPHDGPAASRKLLAAVYKRADKEVAHLTLKFNKPFNKNKALIDAATAIEAVIQKFVYGGKQLLPMDA